LHADFRHDEMAAVAENFFFGKPGSRFPARRRLSGRSHCVSLPFWISPEYQKAERKEISLRDSKRERGPTGSGGLTTTTAAGDGGNDADGVAILGRGVFFRSEEHTS